MLLVAQSVAAGTAQNPAPVSISVEPKQVTLIGPSSEQRLLVTARYADGTLRDLSREARYEGLSPKVIAVDSAGLVKPLSSGGAKIHVRVGDKLSAEVSVAVKDFRPDFPISFANQIAPIMTKAGCNQGACHGSQHGKGGFKLSLLGFEPEEDYIAIVKQAAGRRVLLLDPAHSLLLLKPTLGLAHGGKRRLTAGSYEYNMLVDWLAGGVPGPSAADAKLVSIDILPHERVLAEKDKQQLVVVAHWSDGTREDMTRKARFDSLNDGVAAVTSDGLVTAYGKGAAGVMVRYMGQADVFHLTVPYARIANYPELARNNLIDDRVIAKWKKLGLLPSALATDEEFIRRVYLDTIGALPAPDEIRSFVSSTGPDRRKKLIDQVLARPEWVDFWALKWGDLLRNNRNELGEQGMWSLYNWLRASLRDNKPVDQMTRELITAQGSTYSVGPANYFRVARTAPDLAETTAQVFLGVRLQCAKCHHHPFEKYSQADYYGLAAFFARVGLKGSNEFGLFGREQVVRLNATGEVTHPKTGARMAPTPLEGKPVDDLADRRRALAAWLTSADNRMFARNFANRVWGYFLGRGLVEPIDDLRATNPPSNPELLDALAKDFVDHKFDLKHLMRTILNSRTYQLSSTPTEANARDTVFATHYPVKRLTAEELLDAISLATGSPEKFPGLPLGIRAVQVPDPGYASVFLDTFGRPKREITCECERTGEPNLAQALQLANGEMINRKISDPKGRLARLMAEKKPAAEVIDELYLVSFSRRPAPTERAQAERLVASAPDAKQGLEDLFWALLNSKEFLFNH